jgi:hypothetical protein
VCGLCMASIFATEDARARENEVFLLLAVLWLARNRRDVESQIRGRRRGLPKGMTGAPKNAGSDASSMADGRAIVVVVVVEEEAIPKGKERTPPKCDGARARDRGTTRLAMVEQRKN